MKIIVWIYCIGRAVAKGFREMLFDRKCDKCKGSNGHCTECKHHPEAHTIEPTPTKNLFKRDWDEAYYRYWNR